MRILLIIPPRQVSLHRDAAYSLAIPHIGIAYLAASLRKSGFQVRILDAQAERISLDKFAKKISELKPELVGITAFTEQVEEADRAAQLIKNLNDKIPVVAGGCHPSALPRETLEEFGHFDAAVYGEGEETIVELAGLGDDEGGREKIRGIAYRKNHDVIINKPRNPVENLDRLPFPAFDLFPLERYRNVYQLFSHGRVLPILTSRGCPYQCIYCSSVMGKNTRFRSAENVVDEIYHWSNNYSVHKFAFLDSNFTIRKSRVLEICNLIGEKGLNRRISFGCETRVDLVDRGVLEKLKAAGCFLIIYGVESGNPEILKNSRKGINLEQIENAFRLTREVGIKSQANFLLGFPDEDRRQIGESLGLALKLNPDFCVFSILSPYPGTELMRMAAAGEGGTRLISREWKRFGKHMGSAYETDKLPRAYLERVQMKISLRFYLRVSRILNLFRMVRISFFPLYMLRLMNSLLAQAYRRRGEREQ